MNEKYGIESEIGRLKIKIYGIVKDAKTIYNPSKYIFPVLKSYKENFKSACYEDFMLSLPCKLSYRESRVLIDRIRLQPEDNQTCYRTINNTIEYAAKEIRTAMNDKVEEILYDNGVTIENNALKIEPIIPRNMEFDYVQEEVVNSAIEKLNQDKPKDMKIEIAEIHEVFENPQKSYAQISVDDVLVKHQKDEGRKKGSVPKSKREYVKNSIVHIQKGISRYMLNGFNLDEVFKFLIAFLIFNEIHFESYLIFYADGADDIKNAIKRYFGWIPHKLILDWHHLVKKSEQRLSSALKGKNIRNEVLEKLTEYLWSGKVDSAVKYLNSLDPKIIKKKEEINLLIKYFDRNWSYIPCYALRKEFGLRISSNTVEKSNDLLVSNRQKDNGTSWTKYGSVSLTTITALNLNNEKENWIRNRKIDFKFNNYKNVA